MINATSGISCTQNVKFTSGISAISGIKGTLPGSYQAFYPFVSDFIDQVSNDYFAITNNNPSFGGGGINTVANTDMSVTTFQADKKGLLIDEKGNGGLLCNLGDLNNGTFTNGVLTAPSVTPLITMVGSTVSGKYFDAGVSSLLIDSRFIIGSHSIPVIGVSNPNTWQLDLTGTGLDSDDLRDLIGNDGASSNPFAIDVTRSGYLTSQAAWSTVRTTAGDTLLGSLPTPEQWDVSGDFRFGYIGIGKTVADVTGQVMLQTGNMGISTGIGITFAEIGASISALSVDSDTIVGECFIKYVGGMLSIVIDGAESTPVASAAPVIGAFAQEGANISNSSAAPGTYGGLLFEVL